MLDRLFALSARLTDAKTEVLAGITTFLTMAYILFVNPSILGAAGMDRNAVLLTTAIGAGALMMEAVRHIDFSDFSEGLPAFLTIALMSFAYSIANGISAGLVVYPLLKLVTGRSREVHWIVYVLAVIVISRCVFLAE